MCVGGTLQTYIPHRTELCGRKLLISRKTMGSSRTRVRQGDGTCLSSVTRIIGLLWELNVGVWITLCYPCVLFVHAFSVCCPCPCPMASSGPILWRLNVRPCSFDLYMRSVCAVPVLVHGFLWPCPLTANGTPCTFDLYVLRVCCCCPCPCPMASSGPVLWRLMLYPAPLTCTCIKSVLSQSLSEYTGLFWLSPCTANAMHQSFDLYMHSVCAVLVLVLSFHS